MVFQATQSKEQISPDSWQKWDQARVVYADRRQRWEKGTPDYTGEDRFDNILSHMKTMMITTADVTTTTTTKTTATTTKTPATTTKTTATSTKTPATSTKTDAITTKTATTTGVVTDAAITAAAVVKETKE